MREKIGSIMKTIYVCLMYAFIYIPVIIMIVFSFNDQRSNKQWTGFTTKYYVELFQDESMWKILGTSLLIALITTVITTIVGTLGAVGLIRYRFRGRNMLSASIYIPLIVPGVVFGVALMCLISLLHLPKGMYAIICGHVILTLPYMYMTVRTRLLDFDISIEEASMDLGANPLQTFFKVTLPAIMPGVMSGAVLAFSISLDDVVITDFLAGPNCVTLPMKIYTSVKMGVSPEINAISTVIILVVIIGAVAIKCLSKVKRKTKKI